MKFEHLVQINDPLNPLIEPLTREELWRGLKRRAEQPREFMPNLDAADITSAGAGSLLRILHFGPLTVCDRVRFIDNLQVRHEIEGSAEVPAATLAVTIEEPASGQFFVRFEYEVQAVRGAAPRDAFYDEFVKQAYVEADVEAISTIRRLAGEGAL